MSAMGGKRTFCVTPLSVHIAAMFRVMTAAVLCFALSGCTEGIYRNCPNERTGWQRPSDGRLGLTVTNVVRVRTEGRLLWNGAEVTKEKLLEYLSLMRRMNPTPLTILTADETASCRLVEEVRNEMEQRIGCKNGRCGEGENWN